MKVILIIALTADGKIAKNSTHSASWTSKEDKHFFASKTKELGVVIMGSKTYQTINRPLPNRLNIIITRTPNSFQSQPGILEFTDSSPVEILTSLERKGYEQVAVIGGATINSLFFKSGLIDEAYLTIEPVFFGAGIDLFASEISEANLELLETRKLSDNVILLHYKIIK